jgi:hypothetical protein
MQRQRAARQPGDAGGEALGLRLNPARAFLAQALRALPADAQPQQ